MNRDGRKRSVWQDGIDLVGHNRPSSIDYDVIIIGAGITGVTTGVYLQEKGLSCLIIEANSAGFGTTSGTSAHINTVLDIPYAEIISLHGLDKARQVARSAESAVQEIAENVRKYSLDCDFDWCKGYIYATNEEEVKALLEVQDGIRQVDIKVSTTTYVPIPESVEYAIVFDGQAKFHPTKYLKGMLDVFTGLGGVLITGETVQTITREDNGMQLVNSETGRGWCAKDVIYATHTPSGIRSLNFRLVPYRSYIQVYEVEEDLRSLELVYDMEEPFHYFRTVKYEGKTYLMVGGQDHKTGDHENEQFNFTTLAAFVQQKYTVKTIRYEWSSQYYESQDYLPFIGYVAGNEEGELLATGYGGNGMTFGTLAARMLFDLITSKKSVYQALYAPGRIGPMASFKKLVTENFDVAKKFITGRLAVESLEQFADISKGEAKIVKYEGQKIGLFKDDAGILHAIDPVCQHAACVVKWNNAEHGWDCPCHGARYDADGKLLNGPATGHLTVYDLDPSAED